MTIISLVEIPSGSFMMGSPNEERGRPHLVNISPFLMGKYPVTQAQWQAVAALPQVKQSLDSDPSRFKGANRPVERVSWYDAIEFCARLAQHTGRPYRLPSEAEWEYACRAGTTTPFSFGETLATDVVNYNGNFTYGSGAKGEFREQTTEVGDFPANAFGLYDMHGNVWEWCLDHWHDNYEGAPKDGSAWVSDAEDPSYVIRGGSWYFTPAFCRSASSFNDDPANRFSDIGFRVVCN